MGWALMLDTLRNWCIAVQDPISDNLQFGMFADKACTVLGSIMVLPAPPPPEVLPSTVWGSFADRFAFQWKTPDSTTLTTTLTEEFENSVWTSLISGYPMVAGRAVTWWVLEHLLWIWWMVTDSLMNVVLGRVAWGHTKFVVTFCVLGMSFVILTWGLNMILGIPFRCLWWCRSVVSYWWADPDDRARLEPDDLDWRGPETNVDPDNDFYRDVIKARGKKNRKPHQIIIRHRNHYARLARSQAAVKQVTRNGLLAVW
jgi:hypothetical protein